MPSQQHPEKVTGPGEHLAWRAGGWDTGRRSSAETIGLFRVHSEKATSRTGGGLKEGELPALGEETALQRCLGGGGGRGRES